MSGAPEGRIFEVTLDKGGPEERQQRFTLLPVALSELSVSRLRQIAIKRRREGRRNAITEWKKQGAELPESAQASFAKQFFDDVRADTAVPIQEVLNLLMTMEPEIVATAVWSCSPEIETYEQATEVVKAYGDTKDLMALINEMLVEEQEAVKNLPLQPETASPS